jgi:hypothetical protein
MNKNELAKVGSRAIEAGADADEELAIAAAMEGGASYEDASAALGLISGSDSAAGGLVGERINAPASKPVGFETKEQFRQGEETGLGIVYEKASAFNAGLRQGVEAGLGQAAAATQQLVTEAESVTDEFFRGLASGYLK